MSTQKLVDHRPTMSMLYLLVQNGLSVQAEKDKTTGHIKTSIVDRDGKFFAWTIVQAYQKIGDQS